MSIWHSDWKAGAQWTHRIDAIPRLQSDVEFRLVGDTTVMKGTVLPASRDEFSRGYGIGKDVIYQSNGRRFLSRDVEWWRYPR